MVVLFGVIWRYSLHYGVWLCYLGGMAVILGEWLCYLGGMAVLPYP